MIRMRKVGGKRGGRGLRARRNRRLGSDRPTPEATRLILESLAPVLRRMGKREVRL